MIDDKEIEYYKDKDMNLPLEAFFSQTSAINEAASRVYPFTNERLDKIFEHFDLKGKKVLTVGSSGDQIFYSLLGGSKDITLIDADIFAMPFVEYKMALIKAFDREEFNQLTYECQLYTIDTYRKITHYLSDEAKEFWDTIMLEQMDDSVYDEYREIVNDFDDYNDGEIDLFENLSRFVYEDYPKFRFLLSDKAKEFWDAVYANYECEMQKPEDQRNIPSPDAREYPGLTAVNVFNKIQKPWINAPIELYRSDEKYNQLKDILLEGDFNIKYIYADLLKNRQLKNNKYDLILLSNVYTYVPKSEYLQALNYMYDHNLKNGGSIQYHYVFRHGGMVDGFFNDKVKGEQEILELGEGAKTYITTKPKKNKKFVDSVCEMGEEA